MGYSIQTHRTDRAFRRGWEELKGARPSRALRRLTLALGAALLLVGVAGCAEPSRASGIDGAHPFLATIPSPTPPPRPTPRVPTPVPSPTATIVAEPSPTIEPTPSVSPTKPEPTPTAIWEVIATPAPTPPAAPSGATAELPAADSRVTLPLHLSAQVTEPLDSVIAELRWQDGTTLNQEFPLLHDTRGRRFLISSLDWPNESRPPNPPTQPAEIEIRSPDGKVLARRGVTVLSANEQETQTVSLYFMAGSALKAESRRIPRTQSIGTATLEELLWGPGPRNLAGMTSALPTPKEVLGYSGRAADWGTRARIRRLAITNGVATVDFSKEFLAYGGNAQRAKQVKDQVTHTLTQFSTVKSVKITVDGKALPGG